MNYNEAKKEFISTWGSMGPFWGINRTMAQIHALLLISPEALTTEDVMKQLDISRGNANMNLRELLDWSLVIKKVKAGDRKDYFEAEKEPWKIAKYVARERRKRELSPLIKSLATLSDFEGDGRDKNVKALKKTVTGLQKMVKQTDSSIEMLMHAEESWFWSHLMGMVKFFKD